MIKQLLVLFLTFTALIEAGCQVPNNYMPGFDYKIFKNSSCWKLAKAVHENDSLKVVKLAKEQNRPLNCFDQRFGTSLLDLAILNDKPQAFLALLQAGIDVNARSPNDSNTALFQLCSYSVIVKKPLFYMAELIKYGADVNASVPDSLEGKAIQITCLEQLVLRCHDVAPVKYLLEHGARVDVYPTEGPRALVSLASVNTDLRPLRYLLLEKRVPVPRYVAIRDQGSSEEEILTLRKVLQEQDVTRYPEQQKAKEDILSFLTQLGQYAHCFYKRCILIHRQQPTEVLQKLG